MTALSQSLRAARNREIVPVIPDFKMISPECGPLFSDRDPVEWACRMESLGAPALSVVTEETEFGGSLSLLRRIASAVNIPVLRKDFITCKADLAATAEAGGKAVLLICACLDEAQTHQLYHASLALGLEPLVEAHNERELELAKRLGARLVGINNRDILALEKDDGTVATTGRLASHKPMGALLVSESGILTTGDAREAIAAGADALLVGTAVWRAQDPAEFYRALCEARKT